MPWTFSGHFLLEIVISAFKSNQIREPISETTEPVQKTNTKKQTNKKKTHP